MYVFKKLTKLLFNFIKLFSRNIEKYYINKKITLHKYNDTHSCHGADLNPIG